MTAGSSGHFVASRHLLFTQSNTSLGALVKEFVRCHLSLQLFDLKLIKREIILGESDLSTSWGKRSHMAARPACAPFPLSPFLGPMWMSCVRLTPGGQPACLWSSLPACPAYRVWIHLVRLHNCISQFLQINLLTLYIYFLPVLRHGR